MTICLDLPTGFSSLVHSISDADEVITEVEQCLRSLRQHRNTLAPISQLPQDIFLEIVAQLAAAYEVCEPDTFYGRGDHRPHRWILATHVCRSWRATILGCPRLWRRIYITPNKERVAAFLERSAGCALTFGSIDHSMFSGDNLETMFKKHGARLGAALNVEINGEGVRTLDDIGADDALHLPQLEALRVRLRVPDGTDCVSVLPGAIMPRLKFLSVSPAPLAILSRWVRPTLTRLHFHGTYDETSNPDFWVTLLSGLPDLVELHLECALAAVDPAFAERYPPKSRAHLPRLRELRLMDSDPDFATLFATSYAYLMQHLDFPHDADVHFYGRCVPTQCWLSQCQYALSCLAGASSISPASATVTPVLRPRAVELTLRCDHVELAFATPAPRVSCRELPSITQVALLLPERTALADCASLFALAKSFCSQDTPLTMTVSGRRHEDVWAQALGACFMCAHTLVVGAPYVRDLVDVVEGAVRAGTFSALATIRRVRVVVWRATPYGQARNSDEELTLTRLLVGLQELKVLGWDFEMLDLGAGWVPVEEAADACEELRALST
ncbi:hypothetical protein PsYK624_062120 [Phanerochaete sordida]|uniref:F-box domain-containing protein n=1 Tax=Phanerochaete sordida TaxID=48140 RepID=A0A9P3G942_9APHY|nr:hypothetical protein PsYK624_062120 [Phanerochaete sordida]